MQELSQGFNVDGLIEKLMSDPGALFTAGPQRSAAEMAVVGVLAVLICFLGLKLIRLFNLIAALAVGLIVGLMASSALGLSAQVMLIVLGVLTLGLLILSGIFRRFGAFLVCFLFAGATVLAIIRPGSWLLIAVCLAVALLVAMLSIIWFEPMVIIATSLYGGFNLGGVILTAADVRNPYFCWGIYAAVILIGLCVQFAMRAGEIKRKEVRRAQAVRDEMSKESEIDRARAMLDDE